MSASSGYRIHFFGSPQIEQAKQPAASLAERVSRKGLALLAYLASQQEPVPRSHLADLFWPDKPERQGRRNLSRELSQLATHLPDCIAGDFHALQFKASPEYWLDIWAFEALTRNISLSGFQDAGDPWGALPIHSEPGEVSAPEPAKWREAVELYRGSFLAGLNLEECPDFESWLIPEREFWRQRLIRVLQGLFSHFVLRHQDDQARKYLERWLELDPQNENPHGYLMILLARSGQRSAALAQYERCRRILAEELDVEPTPKLVALQEKIRSGEFVAKSASSLAVMEEAVDLEPPQSRAPASPPHNLPATIKSFLGREQELSILLNYLQNPDIRLVSLVGLGGMGKTELALQAARSLPPLFSDGIRFVPLAGVQPPFSQGAPEASMAHLHQILATAMATALGLTLGGELSPPEQIKTYLRDKALLLVVDNFEHLIEGASFLQELLLHAGQLKLLVTSRERLRLPGEWALELEGLSYPPPVSSRPDWGTTDLPDPAAYWRTDEGMSELASFTAVSLFVERARQGRVNFNLSPQNSGAVVRLCQLVEGMPLGLELLASQVRTFSPEQIVKVVEGNLAQLQLDLRRAPGRHRTLQAVFEWSWNLLAPAQQRLFSQLSVFRGGFEVEAAQAVIEVSWPDLASLLDCSLLRRHKRGRLEIHALLQQFGREKLALYQVAPPGESVQDRHSRYYLTLINRWESDLLDNNPKQAMAECRQEMDNIRQAWQWAVSRGRFDLIARSLTTLVSIWELLGFFQEAIEYLASAIAKVQAAETTATDPAAAKTLQALWGRLLIEQSHFFYELARHDRLIKTGQALLALGARSGLVELTAAGYLQCGKAQMEQDSYEEGERNLRQSLDLAQQAGLPAMIADSFYFMGIIHQRQDQRDEAQHYFEQALLYYRQQGDQQGEENSQSWLLPYAVNQDYVQSIAYLEARLEVAWQRENPINQARLLHLLSRMYLKLGQYQQARVYEEESWQIAEALRRPWFIAGRLNLLGLIAYYLNETDLALQYGYQALEAAKALNSPLMEAHALTTLGHILAAQEELAEADELYKQALTLFQAQNKPEAIMETLAGLAGIALACHELAQAQVYVEELLVHLEKHGLENIDEPFVLCLACYRILRTAGQETRAKLILDQAHTLLLARANRLSDEPLRRSFLENVAANRAIISLHG